MTRSVEPGETSVTSDQSLSTERGGNSPTVQGFSLISIGIDPAISGPEGIAVIADGQLIHSERFRAKSTTETFLRIQSLLNEIQSKRVIVAIEEWTLMVWNPKKGDKNPTGTTWTTIRDLERAGQRWVTCIELYRDANNRGIKINRVNVSTWRRSWKIRGTRETCKKDAMATVKLLFAANVSEDEAEAILIALHAYNVERTT